MPEVVTVVELHSSTAPSYTSNHRKCTRRQLSAGGCNICTQQGAIPSHSDASMRASVALPGRGALQAAESARRRRKKSGGAAGWAGKRGGVVSVRAADVSALPVDSECAPCEFLVTHETNFGCRVMLVSVCCELSPSALLGSTVVSGTALRQQMVPYRWVQPGWACGHARQPCAPSGGSWAWWCALAHVSCVGPVGRSE
jgi:hypothetical protein